MQYISTIVNQNKAAAKKKAIKKPKKKPLLIVYKGLPPQCQSELFICLPEDEEQVLKANGEQMSDKTSYKRIVLTEDNKSLEGFILKVEVGNPSLICT